MALTPVVIQAPSQATGASPLTSITSFAAFTPPANTLLLVFAEWDQASSALTTSISDTIGGLTWTEITAGWHSQTQGGSTRFTKSAAFWAVTGSSPPSGTITITASSAVAMSFYVIKVPGADVANSPIGTTGLNNILGTFGSTQSLTVTTSGSPAAGSCMICAVGQGDSSGVMTQPTDDAAFTNLTWGNNFRSPSSGFDISYNQAGANSATISLPANTSQFWYYDGLLIEVIPAPIPPPPPRLAVAQRAALTRAANW